MIPLILDALTIFFIVASLALLWQNFRAWRRRVAPLAPLQQKDPRISGVDVATPRDEAEECLRQAEQAVTQLDKESWLRMADEWTKLVQDEERQRSDP